MEKRTVGQRGNGSCGRRGRDSESGPRGDSESGSHGIAERGRSRNGGGANPTDANVLPVILGGDIGAYSLARAFHEAYGVKSLVLSQARSHMCADSSILENRVVPQLEHRAVLLSHLSVVAKTHPGRPLMLLGCGDWYVRMIAENRELLDSSYLIPYIGEALLNQLVLKDSFYQLCERHEVPVPRTVLYYTADDPADLDLPFGFPVVAKPASSAEYHYAQFPEKKKVFFLEDRAQLEAALRAVRGSSYTGKFLVQEAIPGDDSHMRILTTYSDRTGRVRFAAFGQTLLEDPRPMGVGNPLAIVSREDNAVVAEAARLLEAVGYVGFANFDIKVDPRDGSHTFFEINTRLGRSNYYVTASGHNVARWMVEDLVEQREFPDRVQVAAGEPSLYTVVPRGLLLGALSDADLKREVRALYARGQAHDPLDNPGEGRWLRRLYPRVFALKQWLRCRSALHRRGAAAVTGETIKVAAEAKRETAKRAKKRMAGTRYTTAASACDSASMIHADARASTAQAGTSAVGSQSGKDRTCAGAKAAL